jgi:hypothetical protein
MVNNMTGLKLYALLAVADLFKSFVQELGAARGVSRPPKMGDFVVVVAVEEIATARVLAGAAT